MGNPGQGNYAAANAFLDRLAFHRRERGLAGQTINWGPWSEIGMSSTAQGQRSFEFGVGTIPPARGIEALALVVQDGRPELGVMPMDWARFITRLPGARTDPLLEVIRATVDLDAGEGGVSAGAITETLLAAAPEDRQALVEQFVRAELAKVLQLDADALPLDQPLNTVGLDSLMALELKNRVEVGMGINLPIVSLIQGPSITQLSTELVDRLAVARAVGAEETGGAGGAAPDGQPPEEPMPDEAELAAMLSRATANRRQT
jgi:myxalamid-type polyketide synthase MxaB/epothilone polyketide synthase D